MTQEKLERINALARLQKERPLSEAERAEQAALRQEYVSEWRTAARDVLEHTFVVDRNGVKHTLRSYHEEHRKK
jgi:uncharacterized protein YnzC (UPF0291/DUF896 family)